MCNKPEDLSQAIDEFNADLDAFVADIIKAFKPKKPHDTDTENVLSNTRSGSEQVKIVNIININIPSAGNGRS